MRKAHLVVILIIITLLAFGACTPAPEPPPDNTLTPPVLLSPHNGANGIQLSPILLWEAVPEAEVYELQISRNSDFSDIAVNVFPVNTSYELSVELAPSTKYYWMVCAKVHLTDPDAPVACSEIWTFTTAEKSEPEPEPTPVKPPPLPEPEPSTAPIKITAIQLATEYDDIGLVADTQYKNRILEVSGTFDYYGIAVNSPFITFETGPDAWEIRAFLADDNETNKAKELVKGDEIVIIGECKGSTVMAIILADCRFITP
jgi:hypothetical protein